MKREWGWSCAMIGALVSAIAAANCSAGVDDGSGASESSGSKNAAATGTGTTTGTGFGSTTGSGTGGSVPSICDPSSCEAAGGTCSADGVCVIVENPGNVDPNTQGLLDNGGSADASFAWLYPYDATVFPRGLIAPTMQFGGGAPDASKVHIHFSGLDYTGYFGASNPGRIQLGDAQWKAVTLAAGPHSDVKVDVTKVSGGAATGPITESWVIAQGSLRGTIYYETYDSILAGGIGSVGIMKIAPGAQVPTVIKTGCGNVCHTASADGSTLVASTGFPFGSASYDLGNNASVIRANGDNAFTYGGIYPDGSFVISSTNYRTWINNPSRLFDTVSGAAMPNASWDSVVTNAAMPAFSPDGKMVAWNREDTGAGRTLSTMQYDHATKTFSAMEDLAGDASLYLGWPAFTPDTKSVVYHAGSSNVFETDADATGDLYIVDVATKQKARLDALDGYQNGQSYLPENDPNLSFAPTVLPVAVGGYFWVVFTSHRSYGNTLPSKSNGDQDGQLWVAAIDIDGTPGADSSHPAFRLDGQEVDADNLRGFWVLDPCKQDGNTCVTGDQCCGGFCDNGMCDSTHTGCSHEFDHCDTAADCCDTGYECINGHCASPPPQ